MTQVGFTLPPWKSEDQARRQREFCAGDPDSPIRCAAGTGTVRCLASPPNALCTPWLRPVAPRAGRHRVPLLRPRPRRCRRSALATPRGQPEQRRRVDDPARGRAVSPDGPPAPRAGRVAVVTAGSSAPVSFPPGWPRAAGRSLTREAAAAPAFRLPQPGWRLLRARQSVTSPPSETSLRTQHPARPTASQIVALYRRRQPEQHFDKLIRRRQPRCRSPL